MIFSDKKDTAKKHIVVIGASFVEGLLVDQKENFTYLVHEKLQPAFEVYPLGISGIPLSGYPHMIKYAIDNFKPDLILVYNHVANIKQAFYTQGEHNIHPMIKIENNVVSVVEANAYVPNRLKRILAKSAFVRYLIGNLQIENINGKSAKGEAYLNKSSKKDQNPEIARNLKQGCDFMLGRIKAQAGNVPVVLLQDVVRSEIYTSLNADKLSDKPMREMIRQSCEEAGITYLDLGNCFTDDYKKNKTNFEFKIDNHWNAYGNKVVGECVYNYLVNSNLSAHELH